MGKHPGRLAALAMFALMVSATPSHAQATGHLRVVFAKAGMIVGAGGGHGTLTYRGRDYPFTVSGVSLGVTLGASAARLVGRADHLRQLSDFPGMYNAVGVGGALAGGVGGVQLKNANGVIITLQGARVGMEFAANLSSIMILLQ
jgi:hypothetical protein